MKRRLLIWCLFSCWTLSGVAAELSHFVAGKVIQAQKLAEQENYSESIKILRALKLSKSYDKAFVFRMLGSYYWQNDQPGKAIKYASDAVTLNVLKPREQWELKRMLADLLINQNRYREALKHYQQLVTDTPPEFKAFKLWLTIAQLHYQLENWQQTLKAIKKYERSGQPDRVQPLSIRLGAQIQLRQFAPAIATVKRLLVLEPDKKDWWMQITGLELKLNRTKAALATLELAKLHGIKLSESNLRLLAQLYGQTGVPERAARILEQLYPDSQSPKRISQIAYYWQRAKEWDRALEKWQLAAKYQARYYWQVAQLQMQQGRYQQALKSLDTLPRQKNSAKIALMRAQALYKLNQLGPALSQARKADRLQPSGEAKNWVKYLTQLHQSRKSQDI